MLDPSVHINEQIDTVSLDSAIIHYSKFIYIMLNKPEGYVSSTDDPSGPTVFELLPDEYKNKNLFPCGRLDKYTTGLLIITNDGQTSHRILSPAHHAEKKYLFTCQQPIERIKELESGVHIEGGYLTKPCKIELLSSHEGYITLTEGKYHQIKQMLYAVGNKVTALKRISMAGIELDNTLNPGSWRPLTQEEINIFTQNKRSDS